MAKITFLTFYNDYAVAVYVLSGILIHAGHNVSAVFFKLPRVAPIPWFNEIQRSGDGVTTQGDIYGSSIDVNPWTDQEVTLLLDLIGQLSPDILAISCRSTDRALVQDVLPQIRQRYSMLIIAGGYGPSLDPEFFASYVDYVYIGEAENSIVELITRIENGNSLEDFNNVAYMRNGTLIKNDLQAPKPTDLSLQTIDVETYHINNNQVVKYGDPNSLVASYKYSTFVGRGCISTCSYCSAGRWYKIYHDAGIKIPKRRNRIVEEVVKELREVREKGYTFIFFRDSFLSGTDDYLLRFFELYEKYVSLPFWAQFFPAQIVSNPKVLEQAVNAGFVSTEIGFQSGSDKINREIFTRFIPHSDTLKYVKMLSDFDINMKYDFIFGNPAETEDDINETIRLIQKLPRKRAYLELPRLIYLDGTPIMEKLAPYLNNRYPVHHYYRIALLYLCAFVMTVEEFDQLKNDKDAVSSYQLLRETYKKYLQEHNITFTSGTHEVPDSITTHRYSRILHRKGYDEVIIWGAGEYYKEMEHVFTDVKGHLIGYNMPVVKNSQAYPPSHISQLKSDLPVFVCESDKQAALLNFHRQFPTYKGMIYV